MDNEKLKLATELSEKIKHTKEHLERWETAYDADHLNIKSRSSYAVAYLTHGEFEILKILAIHRLTRELNDLEKEYAEM